MVDVGDRPHEEQEATSDPLLEQQAGYDHRAPDEDQPAPLLEGEGEQVDEEGALRFCSFFMRTGTCAVSPCHCTGAGCCGM